MSGQTGGMFQSTFAKRIFLLFVMTTLLPISIIAYLSFDHISTQLESQSYEQSRQAGKAIGMELYRRLTLANVQLQEASEWVTGYINSRKKFTAPADDSSIRVLKNLAILGENNNVQHVLRGTVDNVPVLDAEAQQQLLSGKTVMIVENGNGRDSQLYLIKRLNSRDSTKVLIGQVSSEFLWSIENLLPGSSQLAVMHPSGILLYSDINTRQAIIEHSHQLQSGEISGHFEWRDHGESYLASYWSVFTATDFSVPYLVVMVSRQKDDVLAPINDFASIYAPLLLLSISVVALFAANRIHKKLLPLVTLRDATQSIANGSFNTQVRIDSDDEFGQLGDAFNAMAKKLDAQFTSINNIAELDRLILSSFDSHYIVETVLMRIGELTQCDLAAILEIDGNLKLSTQLSYRVNSENGRVNIQSIHLDRKEVEFLNKQEDVFKIKTRCHYPGYLAPLVKGSCAREFYVFPAVSNDRVESAVIIGCNAPIEKLESNLEQLKKFADHVAVALANAKWEDLLFHQAHYDALTDLPNRALLKDRLGQAMTRANTSNSAVGVMFIDLDRFKLVNDSLGHTEGDQLLRAVADRLLKTVRSEDTVVRFGGDEFVIVIPDLHRSIDIEEALGVTAEKILNGVKGEYQLTGHAVQTDMSIGIAIYPRDGNTPDELLKHADAAMYHAKEQGRGGYKYFSPALNAAATRRFSLRLELQRALENNEFELVYQPKVSGHNQVLLGAEVLIRWNHPSRGTIFPGEFITFAEDNGLIQSIGEYVLVAACRQLQDWLQGGLPEIKLAVNVSPLQFIDKAFPTNVAGILSANQLNPSLLELEVTEGAVMKNIDDAVSKLMLLNALGVRLSIDDFGTGYSALSYLRKLPVHTLKIDKSFVDDMVDDQDAHAIVSTIIYLAHQLNLSVVAEGVETKQQKTMLQELQCDELQGNLISKPLTAEEFVLSFYSQAPGAGYEKKKLNG